MSEADALTWAAYAIMGVALIAYTITGGADFGGGLWDLLASGPRKLAQRRFIEHAIAPIWEANHIWLILIIVLMFTAFPRAYAAISTALHIPLLVALVGVVLRGAAFTFRAYGLEPSRRRARWGRVFAWSSAVAPLFLGMSLAALSSGSIQMKDGRITSGFLAGWTTPFAFAVGLFVVCLFALVAAAHLTADARRAGDFALQEDFRHRTMITEVVAGAASMLVLWRAAVEAPLLFDNLVVQPGAFTLHVTTAVFGLGAIIALWRHHITVARILVMGQAALVVAGWGRAMAGHLILPDLPLHAAGARPEVIEPVLWALLAGSILLLPALLYLMRVFKAGPDTPGKP